MDYEERMTRIEEKHLALAESVELLHHDMCELIATVREQAIHTASQGETVNAVLGAMKELIEVVTGHKRRVRKLEESA